MIHGTRSHSVNVSRLEVHVAEYAEALVEYHTRLLQDLELGSSLSF
jgi:hypothetical protein